MKYKIQKVGETDPYFILKIKKWYGWITFQDGGFDDIGPYTYDRRFKSVEDVKKFIAKHFTTYKPVTIKELP